VKSAETKKVRWDPLVMRLLDNTLKDSQTDGQQTVNQDSNFTEKKRRPKKEFEAFLRSLFDRKGPPVKYQNPDAWVFYKPKKGKADDKTEKSDTS